MADNYDIKIDTQVQLESIKSLLVELKAISAEISKINGLTFSAVSASAAELSQTSKDLSKATISQRVAMENLDKSTRKMSTSIEQAKVKTQEFGAVTKTTEQIIQGAYMELGAKITDLSLKIPSFATAAIKAFGEEEVAVQKLSAAIRENGGSVSEALPIMQQFASDMQTITGYADDQILSMQGVATSMGVLPNQMQEVIKGAIGLSSALGMDLQTATRASSAAIQGKTELLTRYIPTLSTCKSEEEKLAKVQEFSRNGFSQAEASMESVEGRLKAAANAWGDLQEVIGEAFAPTVKVVATLVQGLCELFTEHNNITKILTISLSSLAVGFAFTKVGGLLNVAKMFVGLTTATKGATTAMHGLSMAIKANPLGMIASAATLAIMGISSLIDYVSNLETEEEKEAQKQREVQNARKKAAEETKKATAIIEEFELSLKREGETSSDVAKRIDALVEEIEKLENTRGQWAEGEQIKNAEALVAKKKQLNELQQTYLEKVQQTAKAEFEFLSNRETERKYRVEQELNAARKTGIAHIIAFKEAELKHVAELEKSVEIQKQYYNDHAHLVKTEEDRIRIMAEAEKYATASIEKLREEKKLTEAEAQTEKWLNSESEASKERQRSLDLEILRARASGNEEQAKELEGKLRIAQLTNEIFEASRKEGMSKQELVNLQESASKQAQERFNLEKSITEEAERQNLAKNAQAKIEDIIIANKIEQLKAEGKLAEAKELEQEREIRRTLAGLGDAVSDDDKKKLGNMMRQTNDFKAGADGGFSRGTSFGGSSFDGSTSSAISRKNSLISVGKGGFSRGASFGGSSFDSSTSSARKNSLMSVGKDSGFGDRTTLVSGGISRRTGRPATVSAKYAGLYSEYQQAKKAGTAKDGWTAFREQSTKQSSEQKQSANKTRVQAGAFLDKVEKTSKSMTTAKMGGDLKNTVDKVGNNTPQAKQPKAEEKKSDEPQKKPSTPAQQKLQQRGAFDVDGKKASGGNVQEKILKVVCEIAKHVKVQSQL